MGWTSRTSLQLARSKAKRTFSRSKFFLLVPIFDYGTVFEEVLFYSPARSASVASGRWSRTVPSFIGRFLVGTLADVVIRLESQLLKMPCLASELTYALTDLALVSFWRMRMTASSFLRTIR